ncbi:MAG: AbrB/MazE/SpoVT family DNA-binding domain-containing protein [Verrucomicrobiota bacterium]
MATTQAKVTRKGQITLPKAVRQQLSIQMGDRLEFFIDAPNSVRMHRLRPPGSSTGCGKAFLKSGHEMLSREEEKTIMANKIGAKYLPKGSS